MAEPDAQPNSSWSFSLSTMLMIVTIACLATALVLTNVRLANSEMELKSLQPLSVKEVATQFEQQTTVWPITTTVKDVRYSTSEDKYKVRFSWKNIDNDETWSTEVVLKADGYGGYFGIIHSEAFTTPLGAKDGYSVGVETHSAIQ